MNDEEALKHPAIRLQIDILNRKIPPHPLPRTEDGVPFLWMWTAAGWQQVLLDKPFIPPDRTTYHCR